MTNLLNNELLRVDTTDLDAPTKQTIHYLEVRMNDVDERGMLARLLYQYIAQGVINPRGVAERLGAYDPEGFVLDDDEQEAEATDDTQTLPISSTDDSRS